MTEEQINVVLTAINEHHLDNLRDLSFDCCLEGDRLILDVKFSLDNLKLLHRIISDEVLLKLEAIHICSSSKNACIDVQISLVKIAQNKRALSMISSGFSSPM